MPINSNLDSLIKWLDDACAVARASGLGHDVGKAVQHFQQGIESATGDGYQVSTSDPARHEIVSAVVLANMLNGQTWEEAWHGLAIGNALTENSGILSFIRDQVGTYRQAVLFCIATHHKLFSGDYGRLNLDNHARLVNKATDQRIGEIKVNLTADRDSDSIKKVATSLVARIWKAERDLAPACDCYWQGIALVARAALILADHRVSAEKLFHADNRHCFANTGRQAQQTRLNQHLSWHLAQVGHEAEGMVRNLTSLKAPVVSPETLANMKQGSADRFAWQNAAADALTPGQPTLVLNIAATGSGKTRMNARAAAVLAGDQPLRLCVALNLRSLTLQTGDAYRDELELKDDELAVVIGDSAARKMHDYEKADITREDIQEADERDELLVTSAMFEVPAWLSHNCETEAAKAVAMAPVLVSTIDYLINAGDPRKQAKHAVALLRLMHSDLVIDEIDSYEPAPLAAVLRLIKLSALFGRNVIVSSATLPTEIASMIYKSYASGFDLFRRMNAVQDDFHTVIIDDSVPPTAIHQALYFDEAYSHHVLSMMLSVRQKKVTKKAEVIQFDKNLTAMHQAIKNTISVMHDRHRWGDASKLSIGLIRVANIRRAIPLARDISKMPDTYVCCYHAGHFAIQRFHIERRLDRLLKRKGSSPNQYILDDREIQGLIEQSPGRDIKIIVVATPVEEVGRDHDFDWGIIEPSSAQSIVQTAGRINRHRLAEVLEANIAILQFNFREVDPPKDSHSKPAFAFYHPGYETDARRGTSHPNHDLCQLLDENRIKERLDADLRFNTAAHKLSKYDNESIKATLSKLAMPVIENKSHWMGCTLYKDTLLREPAGKIDCHYDGRDWYKHEYTVKGIELKQSNSQFDIEDRPGLFTLTLEQLTVLARDIGLSLEDAFRLSVYDNDKDSYLVGPFGCETFR